MRKLIILLWTIRSAASAAAWSSRGANSALPVAWEWPSAWGGSPAAAEAPSTLAEDNAAEGRGVEMMLSGALLAVISFVGVLGFRPRAENKWVKKLVGACAAFVGIPEERDPPVPVELTLQERIEEQNESMREVARESRRLMRAIVEQMEADMNLL
jgi:hypothetical protein